MTHGMTVGNTGLTTYSNPCAPLNPVGSLYLVCMALQALNERMRSVEAPKFTKREMIKEIKLKQDSTGFREEFLQLLQQIEPNEDSIKQVFRAIELRRKVSKRDAHWAENQANSLPPKFFTALSQRIHLRQKRAVEQAQGYVPVTSSLDYMLPPTGTNFWANPTMSRFKNGLGVWYALSGNNVQTVQLFNLSNGVIQRINNASLGIMAQLPAGFGANYPSLSTDGRETHLLITDGVGGIIHAVIDNQQQRLSVPQYVAATGTAAVNRAWRIAKLFANGAASFVYQATGGNWLYKRTNSSGLFGAAPLALPGPGGYTDTAHMAFDDNSERILADSPTGLYEIPVDASGAFGPVTNLGAPLRVVLSVPNTLLQAGRPVTLMGATSSNTQHGLYTYDPSISKLMLNQILGTVPNTAALPQIADCGSQVFAGVREVFNASSGKFGVAVNLYNATQNSSALISSDWINPAPSGYAHPAPHDICDLLSTYLCYTDVNGEEACFTLEAINPLEDIPSATFNFPATVLNAVPLSLLVNFSSTVVGFRIITSGGGVFDFANGTRVPLFTNFPVSQAINFTYTRGGTNFTDPVIEIYSRTGSQNVTSPSNPPNPLTLPFPTELPVEIIVPTVVGGVALVTALTILLCILRRRQAVQERAQQRIAERGYNAHQANH